MKFLKWALAGAGVYGAYYLFNRYLSVPDVSDGKIVGRIVPDPEGARMHIEASGESESLLH